MSDNNKKSPCDDLPGQSKNPVVKAMQVGLCEAFTTALSPTPIAAALSPVPEPKQQAPEVRTPVAPPPRPPGG